MKASSCKKMTSNSTVRLWNVASYRGLQFQLLPREIKPDVSQLEWRLSRLCNLERAFALKHMSVTMNVTPR